MESKSALRRIVVITSKNKQRFLICRGLSFIFHIGKKWNICLFSAAISNIFLKNSACCIKCTKSALECPKQKKTWHHPPIFSIFRASSDKFYLSEYWQHTCLSQSFSPFKESRKSGSDVMLKVVPIDWM